MNSKLKNMIGAISVALVLVLGTVVIVRPVAISELIGLAVAQTATSWNSVRDGAAGDGLTNGILATTLYVFNGSTFDRVRGDTTNGIDVDVTRISGNIPTQPSQGSTILNSRTVSALNGSATLTLTGVASTKIHLYKLKVYCNPVGVATMTITDGATLLYNYANGVPALPLYLVETWPVGLTAATGSNLVIVVSACETNSVAVIEAEADQF